ncbi:MAG: hypothetical protein H6627_06910 [Calditrichae bacterium]|nr:hypothetical protein [Calditrichota bacterium]MCB9058278.1 hypothetical protein [Calditrichia bacterium]
MFRKGIIYFARLVFIVPVVLFAQDNTLTELNDFYPEKIETAGFVLSQPQEIYIEAKAIAPFRSGATPLTNAWILNSNTRELVWEIPDADDIDRERTVSTYNDRISLEAGKYEVYYSTYPNYSYINRNWNNSHGFFDNLFGNVFYGDDWDIRRRDYGDLFIRIIGNGTPATEDDVFMWQNNYAKKALINWTQLRDDFFEEKILDISKPVDLHIYAIGELRDESQYDFGWIVDLKTREKIWELDYRHSLHAGGAEKNRLVDKDVHLEPGKYKLVFVTDDSHSYRRWNSAPPYDPAFWGVSIRTENPDAAAAIALEDAGKYEDKNQIVKFDRVRDQDYRVQGFSLNKPLDVHIYALGEGRDGEMYDYGWIVNAKSREKVWIMDYYETENAGGAAKNRLYDGIVKLDPGNYIAYYVSDGSHSYNNWNSSAPFDQTNWGMTISAANENFNPSDVSKYDESEDKSILVRITRVGDFDKARAKFQLTRDQKVHVYAIGEGRHNEMYDYAWIENAETGRVVWEMTYRTTERAGGAMKNRLFDGNVLLEAGEYEVFYKTDDSHSFSDWNEAPPDDPVNWGITITRLED